MKIETLIDPFRPANGPPPQSLFAFMKWALNGAWFTLAIASLLSALAGGLEAVTAKILGLVIDQASRTGPENFFSTENIALIIGAVAFFLIARPLAFGFSSAINSVVVGPNLDPLVLSRLHRWTLGQSVKFFDDDFAGRIAQKQMQTARAITDVVVETINSVIFAFASFFGSMILLFSIDWRIAIIFLAWLVGYLFLIRWFLPRVRKLSAARAGARAMVSGQVVDTITNIKTVKLFAHAEHEDRAALGAMQSFRKNALRFGWLAAGFRFALMGVAGLLPVLLIGGTLILWRFDHATPGDIVAAGTVSIRIAQMTGWVSFTLMAIYASIGEVEDGMRTLTPRTRLENADNAADLDIQSGKIEFRDVSFAYGGEKGGIEAISLKIQPGEKIGVVGASGAGKSTLVSILLRLHDPEAGSVLIDDQPLETVTQETLRQNIGMVTQETAMFNRSALDNIRYGNPNASDAEVIEAAKRAEAHDFILDLADHAGRTAYAAHPGERGVKLSGGQRQRIALARAILKDAPILVLDEATSALDSEVESLIQTALERVMDGKTVIAIAHRLSTISQMDRIIVMEAGHIVEQGTHQELLDKDGLYARYWNRQSGGFVGLSDAAE